MQRQETGVNTLFEATPRDALTFKRLIRAFETVSEYIPLTVSKDGIYCIAANPSMTSLMTLEFGPDFFDVYGYDDRLKREEDRIFVNTKELKSAVNEANKGDTVKLRVMTRCKILQVFVNGELVERLSALNRDESDIPSTSKLNFGAEAVMRMGQFLDAVRVMPKTFDLVLDEDELRFNGSRDERRIEVAFNPKAENQLVWDTECHEDRRCSMYTQDLLEPVGKLKHVADEVRLRWGQDFPLRVDTEGRGFSCGLIIAPRIKER